MDPPDKLYEYWRQPEPPGNVPRDFIATTARSQALLGLVNRVIPKDEKILEVGCGVGRNLAALVDAGFTNVEGVEISPHAIKLLRETYPQLADVTIHEGAAEDVLPGLPDDGYELVFSMSTLRHIHPEKAAVFGEMTRIGGQIIVIEGPPAATHRSYPYDFSEIFTSLGMKELSQRPMSDFPGVGKFGRYTATRFRRMDKLASLHEFWRQPTPPGNNPNDYIKATGRSQALLELISDLPKDAHILEVGCNVGRNLAYLYDHGYTNLEGIEINPHAVQLLRQTFPQLAAVPVRIGPAGEMLPDLKSDSFDLVYTMAVIEHIHPDESSVFDNMVRISPQILAIEPPGRLSHRQFPHDVPEVFRSRGMKLVSTRSMGDFPSNAKDLTIHLFNAYRFQRRDTGQS
jgi:SAM-dependent methyltransferase